ncbi:Na+/H+ antiporter subunit E [Rubritalea spongiae]|uniref:Na+/H+ antiporter subunit E n=1 Tax=Rubritalea spongiae TaxID=430797 RepID=A0ABW5E651_9BACT
MIKLVKLIAFGAFYLKEVVVSNIRVAIDIVSPAYLMKPDILTIDVSQLTPRQLLVVTNLITMTPGTLSLDVADGVLYIHSMYSDDAEAESKDLVENYINKVCDVF